MLSQRKENREQGEWTQGGKEGRKGQYAALLKYHWFPMNAPLTAKGSNTAPANSCTSGSHFSVHTSLPWQIHKSLAKEAAVPLPVSDVIFLRWITPPSADSCRSNDQARHRDTATGLWWGWWRGLLISWELHGLISSKQTKSQWIGFLDLSRQSHGVNSHKTYSKDKQKLFLCAIKSTFKCFLVDYLLCGKYLVSA